MRKIFQEIGFSHPALMPVENLFCRKLKGKRSVTFFLDLTILLDYVVKRRRLSDEDHGDK